MTNAEISDLDEHNGLVRRTYSLEGEDILIQKMFDGLIPTIKGRRGFYVDLGAYHPVWASNTYRFYRLGWRGICIEPNPDPMDVFQQIRPEDEVWNFGVARESGSLRYHRFANAGLNGFFDETSVGLHRAAGQVYLGSVDVACISVSDLMDRLAGNDVDLLSIDVETLDAEILGSWDWGRCRPKVICAEVHTLLLKDVVNADITLILQSADYSAISRGWQSVIYVDNSYLRAFAPGYPIP